jgi:hypothetical protein
MLNNDLLADLGFEEGESTVADILLTPVTAE